MRPIGRVFVFLIAFASSAHAYWQQHVSYDIHVTLIDSIHTLDGSLSVVYTNNSPDTLDEVYFHLYSNAFQPGSLMDERSRAIHSVTGSPNCRNPSREDTGSTPSRRITFRRSSKSLAPSCDCNCQSRSRPVLL
jgi:hypothetical protein